MALTPLDPALQKVGGPLAPLTPWFRRHWELHILHNLALWRDLRGTARNHRRVLKVRCCNGVDNRHVPCEVSSGLPWDERVAIRSFIVRPQQPLRFFVTFKESISLKLQGSPSSFDFDQPHRNELLSDFTPVSPAEVSKLLQSMSNKSSQLDYIPTSLVKSCADTFSIIISHLANLSFTQATFPSKFQAGTHLTSSEKAWPTKIRAFKFSTHFEFEHYWQNARTSRPGSSFSSHIYISQFLPFAVCLSQVPFDWDCSAQTHERHHGNYWLWKNHNSDCPRHVRCIRHSWPCHTSPQTSAYFRSVWLCHLMGSLLPD